LRRGPRRARGARPLGAAVFAPRLRRDALVARPLTDYRVADRRRLAEIRARLLARVALGEIGDYAVFAAR